MTRIALLAFESRLGEGTEAGLAWHWAQAYQAEGLSVTVITQASTDDASMDNDWCLAGIDRIGLCPRTRVRAPESPRELLRLSQVYRRWCNASRDYLKAHRGDFALAQHLSLSSVRLPTAVLGSGVERTVWGPLGGGHAAPIGGLTAGVRLHETLRNLSFGVSRARRRRDVRSAGLPTRVYVTNYETQAFAASIGVPDVGFMLTDGITPDFVRGSPRAAILSSAPKLLWLGRMVGSKRPDLAVSTLHELHSRGVGATLVMVGDGPERTHLQAQSRSLRLNDHVHFTGRLPWTEAVKWYDCSDVLLFHSMRDSSCPAVLEAAARGIPTVGLRHQGMGTMVPESVAKGPSSAATPDRLSSVFAQAVVELCQPDAYRSASKAALDFASGNTWQHKVGRVLREVGT